MDNSVEDRFKFLEYWRGQLAGELPRLPLPYDRTRLSEGNHQSAVERFELPESLTHGLKRIAEKSGCSLYFTLLAGVATLLQRYSGEKEMIIGGTSLENFGWYKGTSAAVRNGNCFIRFEFLCYTISQEGDLNNDRYGCARDDPSQPGDESAQTPTEAPWPPGRIFRFSHFSGAGAQCRAGECGAAHP